MQVYNRLAIQAGPFDPQRLRDWYRKAQPTWSVSIGHEYICEEEQDALNRKTSQFFQDLISNFPQNFFLLFQIQTHSIRCYSNEEGHVSVLEERIPQILRVQGYDFVVEHTNLRIPKISGDISGLFRVDFTLDFPQYSFSNLDASQPLPLPPQIPQAPPDCSIPFTPSIFMTENGLAPTEDTIPGYESPAQVLSSPIQAPRETPKKGKKRKSNPLQRIQRIREYEVKSFIRRSDLPEWTVMISRSNDSLGLTRKRIWKPNSTENLPVEGGGFVEVRRLREENWFVTCEKPFFQIYWALSAHPYLTGVYSELPGEEYNPRAPTDEEREIAEKLFGIKWK